jgi:hypothetical protein
MGAAAQLGPTRRTASPHASPPARALVRAGDTLRKMWAECPGTQGRVFPHFNLADLVSSQARGCIFIYQVE